MLSLDTEGASLSFGEAVLLSSLHTGSELFNAGEKAISSEMPLQDERQRTTEDHSEHENDASLSFGGPELLYTRSPTDLIAASSFDGQRIYFGRRSKRQHFSNVIIQSRFSVNFLAYFYKQMLSTSRKNKLNLLQTPLHRLMLEVKPTKKAVASE
jgi:hypothetical protein